jgi:hypothetical protein
MILPHIFSYADTCYRLMNIDWTEACHVLEEVSRKIGH